MHSSRLLSFATLLFLAAKSVLVDGYHDLLDLQQGLIYGQTLMQANVNNTGTFVDIKKPVRLYILSDLAVQDTSGVLANVTNNILASKARLDADPVSDWQSNSPDKVD